MSVEIRQPGRRIHWSALRRAQQRFGHYLVHYRRSLGLAFLCLLGSMVTTVLAPWPLKMVIDALVPAKSGAAQAGRLARLTSSPTMLLVVVCGSVLGIAALAGLFTYGQRLLTARVTHRILAKIRRDLFAHVQRLPLSFHAGQHSGDLVMRMTGDVQMLREVLIQAVMKLASQSFVIAGMLAMMLWLSPLLTLVAAGVFPFLALIMIRFSPRLRDVTRRQRRKESRVASHINETMHSISVVHSFARHDLVDDQMDCQNRGSLRAGLRAARLEERMSRWVELTVALGVCGVLTLGTHLALQQLITVGTLVVFLSYTRSFYKPVKDLSRMWGRLAKASVCTERILDLLDVEPEIRDADDAVEAPPLRGHVVFEGARLVYPERDKAAIEGLDLEVAPGETILVVGTSGAGKTSLARLLLRLYDPTAGSVRVDGADIRSYRIESLREQIAVVLQDSILFGATIRDNIAYGKPGATDEEIKAAAGRVFADSFIEQLPLGLDTVVSEGGVTLSGGERQRLALARAAIKNAPVLIMDEPTTGLDAASQRRVLQGMRALLAGATTFVISHHPGLFDDVDRVIVMEEGRVVEQGTWSDLAAAGGPFAALLDDHGAAVAKVAATVGESCPGAGPQQRTEPQRGIASHAAGSRSRGLTCP